VPALPDLLPIPPFTAPVRGAVRLPGSKSITNRALILAALCKDPVTLRGALFSRDTEIMLKALRALGFKIHADSRAETISLVGRHGIIPRAKASLHVGNAGTAARFLPAFLCLKKRGTYKLDGDDAMRRRPMKGLLDALRQLGAEFEFSGDLHHYPFTLKTHGLPGGTVEVDASASSQILSALMMVAEWADEILHIKLHGPTVSEPFVQMTAKMIPKFAHGFKPLIDAPPFQDIYFIEPDATAASYFVVLPVAAPGAAPGYRIAGLGELTDLQGDIGFLTVAAALGLHVVKKPDHTEISSGPAYRGLTQNFNPFSDTFLTLAALAPLLDGPTRITGIRHTRKQETDRVHAMATELTRLGQTVEETPDQDGLVITPNLRALKSRSKKKPLEIETYDDHRVAMSFAILGSRDLHGDGRPWLAIKNPACCAKTFPDFFDTLESLRLHSLK
jgi:3-phosphoshikimate 1-carboxyvinyltransferase